MSNYAILKSAIQQVVKKNGNNEITGALLQQSLLSMINSLGAGYQFMGVATPSTNPGTPDQKVCYLAMEEGVYPHFNNIEVGDNEIAIMTYDSQWHGIKVEIGSGGSTDLSAYATKADVNAALDGKQNTLTPGNGITINGSEISTTYKIWHGSQAEYDAIAAKDDMTIYLIEES